MGSGLPSSPAVPEQAVATLDEAVAHMVRLDAQLTRDDGVRYFNALYLEVTREVCRRLDRGELEDPAFLETLAVLFSNAYFRAVEDFADGAGTGGSRAWAPLFAVRFDRRVAPIQFALAGMNAHINYDLPIGVRDTCQEHRVTPRDGTPQHRDYVRLNAILADVQERVKPWLIPGALGLLDRVFGRLDDIVAGFSVARARDAAWVHAETLWSLRRNAQLSDSYLVTLDHTVGLAGRGLLAPTLLGLTRWSTAQSWLPQPARMLLGAPGEDW